MRDLGVLVVHGEWVDGLCFDLTGIPHKVLRTSRQTRLGVESPTFNLALTSWGLFLRLT